MKIANHQLMKITGENAEGRSGGVTKVGIEWRGWAGIVAHPNSLLGGGGPGFFRRISIAQLEPRQRSVQDGIQPDQLRRASVPTPANLPPITNPRSLGVLKSLEDNLYDVKIEALIIADDGGSGSGAMTRFQGGNEWSAPAFTQDNNQKITKFSGKFTWKGSITIQTLYAPGARSDQVSAYGRGTTEADVRDRNITLGFHESCHMDDYVSYLQSNKLPDPPTLLIGMTTKEYDQTTTAFSKKLIAYFKDMEKVSVTNTDEVGHRRSTWLRTGTPFHHILP